MIDAAELISRRKFIRVVTGALPLASTPVAARALADGPRPPFGSMTPNRDFYVTSYGGTPSVDASRWSLKIHGLVRRPPTLDYAHITRMLSIRQILTLECIGNPPNGDAIGNAEWTGFKLKP